MRFIILIYLLLPFVAIAEDNPSYDCSVNNKTNDFNCDGQFKIVFVGDSLVSGIGDFTNNNKGGYVLRVKKALPNVIVESYGVAGLTTTRLIKTLAKTFNQEKFNPTLKNKLTNSDVIIIDLGRNDRWFRENPILTYKRLVRVRNILFSNLTTMTGQSPLIVQAVLMLPNRGDQGPWVKQLNEIIIKRQTTKFPADLRFDKVSKRLLNQDQLHPTPLGYATLAKTFLRYVKKNLPIHFENKSKFDLR